MHYMTCTYLTGVSTDYTKAQKRADLGLLVTPATSLHLQRSEYAGGWAADNGCFNVKTYVGDDPWLAWLERIGAEGCRFATLPDVVGDMAATIERSRPFVEPVRALGFPVAIVLQNGLERMPELWREILETADAVFVGGSPECRPCGWVRPRDDQKTKVCPTCGARLTEWKLSADAARFILEAKAAGLYVHVGRVNSCRRMTWCSELGVDSADGTFVGFSPTENGPRMVAWLDKLSPRTPTPFESYAASCAWRTAA
jgi:hypothetical protein